MGQVGAKGEDEDEDADGCSNLLAHSLSMVLIQVVIQP